VTFHRPWLYPKQEAAIYDKARISCIEASTKSGKTHGCIVWLVEQGLFGGGGGRNYWWVAPVSEQAAIAFTRMQAFLPRGTFTVNRQRKAIVLMNNAIVFFKSGDRPDSLYGEDVYAAVVDEASRLKEEAWNALRTTLSKTQGRARIIGNVKGRKNWFFALSRLAEQRQRDGFKDLAFHRIVAPDAVDAGVLPEDEIEAARGTIRDPRIFRELYFAEAGDDYGNPFGDVAISNCLAPMSTALPVWWGWDLAKKQDWTVGIGLDAQGRVCRFLRFQMPWEETIKMIFEATGRCPALVDSTGVGDPIVERLQRPPPLGRSGTRFEGFHFHEKSKQKIMEGLAVVIQSKNVTFPPGVIEDELRTFEYEYTRTGVRYCAPSSLHDDCVCALALAEECRLMTPAPMQISDAVLNRLTVASLGLRRH
jgi:hypothetical protein